ncbi:hypothetical protein E2542_SST16259 [Spatholobus suberectus]|nr:hypothetical protein E2542_SST16259 [Spatholobus suberectus]
MPNNLLYNHVTPGLKSPSEIKVTEVEIPDSVLMEDNSNVEKAEMYMKELEDICNMLKKKHEEAKELLIRAIVNDNYLLMLNHPIYEEEISSHSSFTHFLLGSKLDRLQLLHLETWSVQLLKRAKESRKYSDKNILLLLFVDYKSFLNYLAVRHNYDSQINPGILSAWGLILPSTLTAA